MTAEFPMARATDPSTSHIAAILHSVEKLSERRRQVYDLVIRHPDKTSGELGRLMFKAFPELEGAIEDKDLYTTRDVSNLTRDSVLPGQGGETIGLAQIVGQCGPSKPSIKAPIRGLYFVGCDAGGTGVGTQQAIESGMNVADAVWRYHHLRRGTG